MVSEASLDNKELIMTIQIQFSAFEHHKIDLIKEINTNPYFRIIIYSTNNEVLGFIHYDYIYDRYEVSNIIVKPSQRGKRIGSVLLEYLIELAKKDRIKNITLEVDEKNFGAIHLYEKYGFKKIAIRSKYYGDSNGILMERKMM